MKTNLTLTFFLLFAFGMTLNSQEILIDGKLYKNAKLQTLSGKTFKANITVTGDSINIIRRDLNFEFKESLQKINRIEIPTRPDFDTYQKNILKGTAIGFGIGLVSSVATTLVYQRKQSKTRTYDGGIPWHCSGIEGGHLYQKWENNVITETTISGEYKMILEPWIKIGLALLPTSVGFLNGILKKELKTIYLKDSKALNRIDYNIYYNPAIKNMSLNFSYNF